MVSRRTNFGERSEPAPDRGGKLQSAGGRHKVTFRHCIIDSGLLAERLRGGTKSSLKYGAILQV